MKTCQTHFTFYTYIPTYTFNYCGKYTWLWTTNVDTGVARMLHHVAATLQVHKTTIFFYQYTSRLCMFRLLSRLRSLSICPFWPPKTGSGQFKWKGPRRARTFFPPQLSKFPHFGRLERQNRAVLIHEQGTSSEISCLPFDNYLV